MRRAIQGRRSRNYVYREIGEIYVGRKTCVDLAVVEEWFVKERSK